MSRPHPASSLVLALAACTSPGTTLFVERDMLGAEVVFMLGQDERGGLTEILGPVILDDGAEKHEASFVSNPPEIVLVGWTHAGLLDAFPLYDRARAPTLGLSVGGAADCAPGRLEGETEGFMIGAAPSPTRVVSLRPDEDAKPSAAPPGLQLRVPVDPDACVPAGQRVLTPFADVEFPIPLDGVAKIFRQLRQLRDGRVLAMTGGWFLLFERGQPLSVEAPNALDLPGLSLAAFDIDEDETRQPEGTLITVVGRHSDAIPSGEIIDLRVTASGLSMLARTPLDTRIDDIAIRPADGRLVGISGLGTAIVREAFGAPLERIDGLWTDTGNTARIGLSGDPMHPFVAAASGRGGPWLGDASGRTWTPSPAEGFDINARVRALARVPEGKREVWAGTSEGRLLVWRMQDDGWQTLPMRMPPAFESCGASAGCGFFDVTSTVREIHPYMQAGVSRVFASLSSCVGLIDVRVDGRCAALIRVGERAVDDLMPDPFSTDSLDFRSIDLRDGRLVLGSQEGGLYVLDVPGAE